LEKSRLEKPRLEKAYLGKTHGTPQDFKNT
jgi:hypothetical protein